MKKILSVFLILLIFSMASSCAQKNNDIEPYIEFDAGSNADDIKDNDTEQNDDTEQQPVVDDLKEDIQIDDLTDNTQDTQPPSDDISLEQEDKEQPADESAEEPEDENKPFDILTLKRPNKRYAGYYTSGGAPIYFISHNNNTYLYYDGPTHFPQNTIYENVDLAKLTATGEKAVIEWYSSGSLDNSILHTEEVEIYGLPEDMKNDPYVNMIAVKHNGNIKLFYSHIFTRNEGDKFYKELLIDNRFCGHECLVSENIKEILLTTYSDSGNVTEQVLISDPNKTAKLYSMFIEAPYSSSLTEECKSSPAEHIYTKRTTIQIKFKDGSGFDLCYYYKSKSVAHEMQYFFYKATPEFEEYLLSLF